MPVTKKDLYIAKNIGELNKLAELPMKMSTTNSKILVKTADKMLKEAEHGDSLGDEERAYVLYMKYFNVVSFIKKTPEYKKQKQYYDSFLGQKNLLKSIDKAEELAESLKERYEEFEAKLIAEKLSPLNNGSLPSTDEPQIKDDKSEEKLEEVTTKTDKEAPPTQEGEITPTALYNLLQESDSQMIIMDVRPQAEFNTSHINHISCINVPSEIIPPGSTVNHIEKVLPEDSKSLWQQRGHVDHIILLDWKSNLQDCSIGSTLRTLKDALFKYDSTVIIRSEPLVLEGGYDQWLLYYPQLTTNANISRPTTDILTAPPSLDFDYPDFDEAFATPTPDQTSQNQANETVDQSKPSLQSLQFPKIDRSTKPKVSQTAGPSGVPSVVNSNSLTDNEKINDLKSAITSLYPSTGSISGGKYINVESYGASSLLEKEKEELNKIKKEKEEELARFQLEKDKILKEQQARIERLREEEERLKVIEEKKSEQTQELANLMRKKKGLQLELKGSDEESSRKEEVKKIENENYKRMEEVEKLRQERKRKEEERRKLEMDKEKEELEQARARVRLEEEKRELELRLAEETARRLQKEEELDIEVHEMKQRELKTKIEEQRKMKELQRLQDEKALKEKEEKLRRMEEERHLQEKERAKKEEIERESMKKLREKEEAMLRQTREAEERARAEKLAKEDQERREAEQKAKIEQARMDAEQKARKEAEEKEKADLARKQAEEKLKLINAESPKIKTIPSPNLPSGWEKRLDPPTHRYYYIDHNRGTTQWEPPQAEIKLPASGKYSTKLKDEPTTSKRGLSRSNSSPNIAKMIEDEDSLDTKTILRPNIDRSNKPMPRQLIPEMNRPSPEKQAARFRNLNPVYGNVGRALTGLRNMGNTCYMNSTIQCLNNCSLLVTYFLTDSYLYDINRESELGSHGEVADDFAVIVKGLWSGQYKCVTPRDFKITVGKHQPMFAGYDQQDSQEFLTFLLDALHEGLNKVRIRPKIPEQDNDNLPDHVNAELSWKHHRMLHESIIVELFQGQLKSTLQCLTCRKQSVTFQAFMYLSLPIPSGSRCRLDDCLQQFLKPEKMTGSSRWRCPRCKVDRDSVKKIDIWKLPRILLIGLNRFVYEGQWRQKISAFVDFPVKSLNLSGVVQSTSSSKNIYNLYGISNHYGTMDGGHYTAFCRNPCTKHWYKYDDDQVFDMSESDVKSSAAFVLYYTSVELQPPDFRRNF